MENQTIIFESYEAYQTFIERRSEETTEPMPNGVSREFAEKHPNWYAMNVTNVECWNCFECEGCTSCDDCAFCVDSYACINVSNINNGYRRVA